MPERPLTWPTFPHLGPLARRPNRLSGGSRQSLDESNLAGPTSMRTAVSLGLVGTKVLPLLVFRGTAAPAVAPGIKFPVLFASSLGVLFPYGHAYKDSYCISIHTFCGSSF